MAAGDDGGGQAAVRGAVRFDSLVCAAPVRISTLQAGRCVQSRHSVQILLSDHPRLSSLGAACALRSSQRSDRHQRVNGLRQLFDSRSCWQRSAPCAPSLRLTFAAMQTADAAWPPGGHTHHPPPVSTPTHRPTVPALAAYEPVCSCQGAHLTRPAHLHARYGSSRSRFSSTSRFSGWQTCFATGNVVGAAGSASC